MKLTASKEERSMVLPGDELLTHPRGKATHAISINSNPINIYPWLKQMGCQRGGWYSYDKLDNGGVPSAQQIIPEFQNLQIGDYLPARPKDPPGVGFRVSDMKENEYLVLTTFSKFPSFEPIKDHTPYKKYWKTTWTFCLKEMAPNQTRLLVRSRVEYNPWWIGIFEHLIARPMHFIMQRKQLMNIKIRAEKSGTALSLLQLRKHYRRWYVRQLPTEKACLPEDILMQRMQELVKAHFGEEEFTMTQLCQEMAMSRTQLYRKLHAITGQGASQYLRAYRLHRAKTLLKETNLNVSEIAYLVGFKDLAHFSRSFKAEFGLSPSALRNQFYAT